MAKKPEQQNHPLRSEDGTDFVTIYRDGRHRYWTNASQDKHPSVSSIVSYLGPPFGAGVGYAKKQLSQGVDPVEASARAREIGSELHQSIHEYITNRTIDEDNRLFIEWLKEFSNTTFLASEQFVHLDMKTPVPIDSGVRSWEFFPGFGGTLDAVSITDDEITLHDWKTLDDPGSYESILKREKLPFRISDAAQIGGYAHALYKMGSAYAPQRARITYIFRDGSGTKTVPLDITICMTLFFGCGALYMAEGSARGLANDAENI